MSLREVARFTDVYEADLAAAFLESHGIPVTVTERFQTTIDPLMQRALGIRILAPGSMIDEARDLMARARAGEFATTEGDDLAGTTSGTRAAGSAMAVAAYLTGGFWGTSLPRRFRAPAWQGMLLAFVALVSAMIVIWLAAKLVMDPP